MVKLQDMISIIEKNLGKKAIIEYEKKNKADVDKTLADISKAKKLLKFEPEIDIELGIKRFVNWYKDNLEFYQT